ncbi:MAG: fatty acid desaturase, partial [Mycobacterium sp.]|nr:fatty acid desaturase [Mycobacterium sp.]
MAITDIAAYAHLNEADIEALGRELDAIRVDIEESLGEKDRAYIRHTILFQRTLDVVARLLIAGSRSKAGWVLGTASLAFAKSVENMEIGH